MINKSTSRFGITLMEVLISIFVVSVGLLGVAALIPLAGHQTEQGSRNDRKANVGRRSFREFMVRGLNEPGEFFARRWIANSSNGRNPMPPYDRDPNLADGILFDPTDDGALSLPDTLGYLIDPLFMTGVVDGNDINSDGKKDDRVTALPQFNAEFFPQVPTIFHGWPSWLTQAPYPNTLPTYGGPFPPAVEFRLVRLSLSADSDGTMPMTFNQAEELGFFRDDLNFQLPEGSEKTATQSMLEVDLNENGTIDPGESLKRDAAENYSWVATLFPRSGSWLLSTVIIRDRNLLLDASTATTGTPPYPGVPLAEITGVINGNDLSIPPLPASSGVYSLDGDVRIDWGPTDRPTVAALDGGVPVGSWILVCTLPGPSGEPAPVHNWYRVSSAAELEVQLVGETLHAFQDLVLVGPPLLTQPTPPGGPMTAANMVVGYIVGTEAVYQKTIKLEL